MCEDLRFALGENADMTDKAAAREQATEKVGEMTTEEAQTAFDNLLCKNKGKNITCGFITAIKNKAGIPAVNFNG
jgi:hypothetical protein